LAPTGRESPFSRPGAAIWGVPGYAVYAATKAALERIGESLRVELQPHGITVSLVSPGPVNTPMFQTPRIYGDNPWVATAKPRHPDAVAERVVKKLETGAFRIDLSPRASVLRLLAWGAPGSLAALFRHCLRRWAQTGGRP
jgi:NAD(P)-dependent dehydrogenase (short-subunit alcohol dehydrogenase family)